MGRRVRRRKQLLDDINPLNAELNPICHLLALLGAHHILHVSRIRVKATRRYCKLKYEALARALWRTSCCKTDYVVNDVKRHMAVTTYRRRSTNTVSKALATSHITCSDRRCC